MHDVVHAWCAHVFFCAHDFGFKGGPAHVHTSAAMLHAEGQTFMQRSLHHMHLL